MQHLQKRGVPILPAKSLFSFPALPRGSDLRRRKHLRTSMERIALSMPDEFGLQARRKIHAHGPRAALELVINLYVGFFPGKRRRNVLQLAQVRLDDNSLESECSGADSRHDREQVKIRVRAPGVRIGPRWFGLLRPGAKTESKHFSPRTQKFQITVAHAGMIESTREIKAVVVGSFFHRWQIPASFENGVTHREHLGHHFSLALLGITSRRTPRKLACWLKSC